MPSRRSRKPSSSTGQKSKRQRKPNVYVAPEAPAGRHAIEHDEADAIPSTTGAVTVRPVVRRARSRTRGGARSEVFARTLPFELRKMGALAAAIVVSLAVLTVFLR